VRLLAHVILIGGVALLVVSLIDRLWYGVWTLAPLNFVRFNFGAGVGSAFYGSNPAYFYFTEGLVTTLGIYSPLFLFGVWNAGVHPVAESQEANVGRKPAFVILGTVLVLSASPHKEPRFLMPLLPIAFAYCGSALKAAEMRKSVRATSSDTSARTTSSRTEGLKAVMPMLQIRRRRRAPYFDQLQRSAPQDMKSKYTWSASFRMLLAVTFSINVGAAAYLSLVHQRGPISAIRFIRREAEACKMSSRSRVVLDGTSWRSKVESSMSVLFLTPCHATPLYSQIHFPIATHILDCSPPGTHAARVNTASPGAAGWTVGAEPRGENTPSGRESAGFVFLSLFLSDLSFFLFLFRTSLRTSPGPIDDTNHSSSNARAQNTILFLC
jgi:phosphatidylinositol glycan class B